MKQTIYSVELLVRTNWEIVNVFIDEEEALEFFQDCQDYYDIENIRFLRYSVDTAKSKGVAVDYSDPDRPAEPLKKQFQGGESWASKSQNPYAYAPSE